MKTILLTLRPKECKKIFKANPTEGVCLSKAPEAPFRAVVYCTKYGEEQKAWQGQVLGEFICTSVEEDFPIFGDTPQCFCLKIKEPFLYILPRKLKEYKNLKKGPLTRPPAIWQEIAYEKIEKDLKDIKPPEVAESFKTEQDTPLKTDASVPTNEHSAVKKKSLWVRLKLSIKKLFT